MDFSDTSKSSNKADSFFELFQITKRNIDLFEKNFDPNSISELVAKSSAYFKVEKNYVNNFRNTSPKARGVKDKDFSYERNREDQQKELDFDDDMRNFPYDENDDDQQKELEGYLFGQNDDNGKDKNIVLNTFPINEEEFKQRILREVSQFVLDRLYEKILNFEEDIEDLEKKIKSNIYYILLDVYEQERWAAGEFGGNSSLISKDLLGKIRDHSKNRKKLIAQRKILQDKGEDFNPDDRLALDKVNEELLTLRNLGISSGSGLHKGEDFDNFSKAEKINVDPIPDATQTVTAKEIGEDLPPNPEEILLMKQRVEIFYELESSTLNETEKEILRLTICGLSQPEISMVFQSPEGKRKKAAFSDIVDLNYFKKQINKCSELKDREKAFPFELRIFDRASEDIKVILRTNKPKGIKLKDLDDFFEHLFYNKDIFHEKERQEKEISDYMINNIFRRSFSRLTRNDIYRLNLLTLYRIYPKQYPKDVFSGFELVVQSINRKCKEAKEKMRKELLKKYQDFPIKGKGDEDG